MPSSWASSLIALIQTPRGVDPEERDVQQRRIGLPDSSFRLRLRLGKVFPEILGQKSSQPAGSFLFGAAG
jgi:hypothetical protein